MKKTTTLLLIAGAVLVTLFFVHAQNKPSLISPADALNTIQNDSTVVLLDVRTPGEFNGPTGHLANALCIPVQELEQRVNELDRYKQRPVIVYCRTGHRSTQGTEILLNRGFNAVNMAGGITRWNAERLPVVHETQSGR